MFDHRQLLIKLAKDIGKTVAVLAVTLGIIMFFQSQIEKLSRSLEEQHISVKILETKNESVAQLRKDFARTGDAENIIARALPPVDDISEFVSTMEALPAYVSLQQSINYGNPQESADGDGLVVDYNFSLNGNILTLINYLKSHERLPYFTHVRGLNISALNENWEGDSRANLVGRLYTRSTSPAE
ncbi:MAG: hypothetical protein V1856_00510 [Candidatus Liptonbacteria bacterium]